VQIIVPSDIDITGWPTLGPAVAKFIEGTLTFGPGDLRGKPAVLDDEKRALLWILYQVYPEGHRLAGRRRWKRAVISLRKGTAKSELLAWIAHAELHPSAPVRCKGWRKTGPLGGPVDDPFIPLVTYTEEQTEELSFGAVRAIAEDAVKLRGIYDVGLERIMRMDGKGKCAPFATSPNSSDGARTTFQGFDETHRLVLPNMKKAHKTMMANIPKRKRADAWSLEVTTAFSPGEHSIAEDAHDYALAIQGGKRKADSAFLYYHRQARESHDLTTPEGLRAAVVEASGPAEPWSDIDEIVRQWSDPTNDRSYLARVWLNQIVRASDRAFDVARWASLKREGYVVPPGSLIVLGFDGARFHDATALVAEEVATGYQFLPGETIWECPHGAEGEGWEVNAQLVHAAVEHAMKTWKVWRMYADPPYWETEVDTWAGLYGDKTVIKWRTNQWQKMAAAVRAFQNGIISGDLSHDGSPDVARHVGNCFRMKLNYRDDRGERLWVVQKERADSTRKIDAAVASVLCDQARRDALAEGVLNPQPEAAISVFGGGAIEDEPEPEYAEEMF
jgi:phage terminase large subunit-like protein